MTVKKTTILCRSRVRDSLSQLSGSSNVGSVLTIAPKSAGMSSIGPLCDVADSSLVSVYSGTSPEEVEILCEV